MNKEFNNWVAKFYDSVDMTTVTYRVLGSGSCTLLKKGQPTGK